jgi:hypothetical protein
VASQNTETKQTKKEKVQREPKTRQAKAPKMQIKARKISPIFEIERDHRIEPGEWIQRQLDEICDKSRARIPSFTTPAATPINEQKNKEPQVESSRITRSAKK